MTMLRLGNALDLEGYPISPVVVHGDLAFTAGVIPIDPITGDVLSGDIGAQTTLTVDNLAAVLGAVGAALADVLTIDVVLADVRRDFEAFNSVYTQRFRPPYPARRTIGAILALPHLLIEMQATARLRGDGYAGA